MKCIICHGQDIGPAQVNERLELGKDIVSVPVQALVCHTCGERYYHRRTVRYLEEVKQKLQLGHLNLQEVGKILSLEMVRDRPADS
jgi:YgiT-type zinc finger domain-containing protein